MEEINKRCISRKEYLKKYDSNVGYSLYVQDNIRKDDYVRLNTGNIVKVIGIKANTVNKRAIYYGFYKQDWFDSAAVENFSDNIIDLIEIKDLICFKNTFSSNTLENEEMIIHIFNNETLQEVKQAIEDEEIKIISILTKEQYIANCYKVGGEDE